MNDTLRSVGLDLVARRLDALRLGALTVERVSTVLGRADVAGSSRPLPSSAALIRLGDEAPLWVPAPAEPADPESGRAPVYLHAGRELVLPTVRLFLGGTDTDPAEMAVEFLTLSDWLHDAVAVWRLAPTGDADGPGTLLEQLARQRTAPAPALPYLARLLHYALFGADGPSTVCGLRLPAAPMWLRPAADTPFARAVARALVMTARRDPEATRASVPTTNLRAAGYRIRPAEARDWGLDSVHTPEGADIRLTGRLGEGVAVSERKLYPRNSERPPLSLSTSRLPFVGYDDPRRVLMAANMQASAITLPKQEVPLVRTSLSGDEPPGVNLRVGYLAWHGWNHEDAWVLSKSAADRLGTFDETVHTIAVRAVELAPELLVQVGWTVERGQLLVRRSVCPALLCSSLALLASLPELDETVPLRPEFDDTATTTGTVTAVEEWDLRDGRGVPDGWEIPGPVSGAFRCVLRVHIRRLLPLAVGDKLANRHGHKGVVGAILPDDEMPRWRGRPLEALIDPVSVLNRSNWGQVYECLAGATVEVGGPRDFGDASGAEVLREAMNLEDGPDERGRWPVQLPGGAVRAVAGVQFVMRMPHHACDKISASPPPPRGSHGHVRRRSQRLGEMEHWALWAHGAGTNSAAAEVNLAPAAARLRRLLYSAGFEMSLDGDAIRVRRLPIDREAPADVRRVTLTRESRAGRRKRADEGGEDAESLRPVADLYDALDAVTPDAPAAFLFNPPLPSDGATALCWLPVLPACDRPPRRLFDGSEETHELTTDLRRVGRLALRLARRCRQRDALAARIGQQSATDEARASAREVASAEQEIERARAELRHAACRYQQDAYAAAVGRSATGQFSSKRAFLRRGVLGRRQAPSARATVSPGGTLGLDLDEIGLPEALAHVVCGARVWLKRDPVLHRWGLLPVRVRLVPGDTIRLPASLLGPLGADFDGDTVAIFGELPGAPADGCENSPPALAWHPVLQEAMFKPGKQYQYGLFLISQSVDRTATLQDALAKEGAPAWPAEPDTKKAQQEWTRLAVERAPLGRWWAVLEEHALAAVASDPTLGFGLGDVNELANLPVVRCGAAKDLYGSPHDRAALADILRGDSLAVYRRRGDAAPARDPIADVMVAAKASIGQFGGALRRLIYSAPRLRPEDVQTAQCLTEQVTQKALSVKAGKPPIHYADFERHLRRLLSRKESSAEDRSDLRALLAEIGKNAAVVWEHLESLMPPDAPPWLEWLRKPHELAAIVDRAGEIRLPLDDVRVRGWLGDEGSRNMAWQDASL